MIEYLGIAMISLGIIFDILGCIGLLRLPNVYNRLQAATKCVTLGTCMILLGVMILINTFSGMLKTIVCIICIIITSPTSAHALARGAYLSGIKLWDKSVIDNYGEDKTTLPET